MKAATYYVLDLKLCELREWSEQRVEWLGASVQDAAADAALFWAKGDAEDDLAQISSLDGTLRTVIAATRSDGADAREYEILIRVEFHTSVHSGRAVDVGKRCWRCGHTNPAGKQCPC